MVDWIEHLKEISESGAPAVMVTTTKCSGSTPREIGAKMLVLSGGQFHGTIGGGNLEHLAIEKALQVMASGEAGVEEFPLGSRAGQCCGGKVELLFEPINCGPALFVFGAGHVGQALCQVFEGTPFRLFLIDERSEWVQAPGLPKAVHRVHGDPLKFAGALPESERNYVVVMTHLHSLDEQIVELLLPKELAYLGLIGSQTKWRRMRHRIALRGGPAEELDNVVSPIGMAIGGKSPKEVAISLAAELIARHYGNYAQLSDPAFSSRKIHTGGYAQRALSLSSSHMDGPPA